MRINKAQMNALHIIAPDKGLPLLDNVHIAEDGTVVAANGQAVVVVSPLPHNNVETPLTIHTDTIKEVLKALPTTSAFKDLIDEVEVAETDDGVQFAFDDGARKRMIEAKVYGHEYIDWQEHLTNLIKKKSHSLVLNRKRLVAVLNALEKIYPDKSGEFPIYVDVTDTALIFRMVHPRTQQRIIATMLLSSAKEMPLTEWEKQFFPESKPKMLTRVKQPEKGAMLKRRT